ncbi:hypothetical protein V6N12_068238 [Hibiscus sabdariffa]|uniref:Uncharacterized protein n=1 Tax=Hibiscus sabdariffa TaxID=183260 RepID=A0ABR2FPH6_9ROSI
MSDILKMMANLRFTEKEIDETDTLHFEDEHQVEGISHRGHFYYWSEYVPFHAIVVNGDNGKGSRVEGSKGRSYKRCYGRKDIEGSLAIKKARSETGVNVNVADDGPEDTPPQKAIVSVEADAQPSREP